MSTPPATDHRPSAIPPLLPRLPRLQRLLRPRFQVRARGYDLTNDSFRFNEVCKRQAYRGRYDMRLPMHDSGSAEVRPWHEVASEIQGPIEDLVLPILRAAALPGPCDYSLNCPNHCYVDNENWFFMIVVLAL